MTLVPAQGLATLGVPGRQCNSRVSGAGKLEKVHGSGAKTEHTKLKVLGIGFGFNGRSGDDSTPLTMNPDPKRIALSLNWRP